jgi:hypothetical protein
MDLLNRLWAFSPTAASVAIGGRVTTNSGRGISSARVTMTDQSGNARYSTTNQSGFYRFAEVPIGATYTFDAAHKRFRFDAARTLNILEETNDLDFIARP